jgi:hypothetical protein
LVDDQEAIEEIDLSEKHAAALRDAFAPFVGSARRAGGSPVASRPRMSTRAGRPREETAAIPGWATANGIEVSTRGRISSTVLEAYGNHGNAAVAAATVVQPAVEAEAEAKPRRRTRKKVTADG